MDDEYDASHMPATILLVEDERELSVEIKQLLENIGYHVVVASNEKKSLALLAGSRFKVGLILINQHMLSDEVLAIGRRIREDEHVVASAPVVVLPFEFDHAMEGTDENMGNGDYKSYIEDWKQLGDLLGTLLPL
jgi:response regulator RpfG family c-di-GMP phosphodiesterase